MRVTSIQLSGFKSFAEATTLPVGNGLTVVVGPNGCGKSNIIEAVRWVMGESSAKRLRGAGMDDVIFAGAGKRGKRRNASVSLHLDNSDGTAPAPFQDAPELVVSRSIERGSGSTFRINAQEVRARDVQMLFADLSIGSRSASIISQGEIADLVDSKPDARRLLLEEAAGIRGLQVRRHDAELKLAQTEYNLERLQDVVQQAQTQLAQLEKQAKITEKYRQMRHQARQWEALDWYLQDQELLNQLNTAQEQLQQAEAEFRLAETGQRQAQNQQVVSAAKVLKARQRDEQQLVSLQSAQENVHQAQRIYEQTQMSQRAEADRAEAWQADLQHNRQLLQQSIDHLQELAQQQDTGEDEEQPELGALEAAFAVARQKRDEAQHVLDTARQKRLAAEANLVRLQTEHQLLLQQIVGLKVQCQNLARTMAETPVEPSSIVAGQESLSLQIAELRQQTEESGQLAQQAYTDWQQQRQAHGAFDQAKTAWDDQKHQLRQLHKEHGQLQALLHKQEQGQRLIDDWLIPPHWQKIVFGALQAQLYASSNSAAEQYQTAAAQAAQVMDFAEGITPLAQALADDDIALPKVWHDNLAPLLSMIGLVDDLDRYYPRLQTGQILVDHHGNVAHWHGLRVCFTAADHDARLLGQRFRLRQLEQELPQQQEQCNVLEKAFLVAQAAWQEKTEALHQRALVTEQVRKDNQAALSQAERDKRTLEDRYQAELAAWQTQQMQTQANRQARNQAQSRLAELQQQHQRLEEQKTQAEQQQDEELAAVDVQALQQGYVQQRQDCDDAQSALMMHKARIAAARESFQRQRSEKQRLEQSQRIHQQRIADLQGKIDCWQQGHPDAEAALLRLSVDLHDAQRLLQQQEKRRTETAQELQQRLAAEADAARAAHSAGMRLAQRQEAMNRLDTAFQVKQQQRDSLHQAAKATLSLALLTNSGALAAQFDITPAQFYLPLVQIQQQRAELDRRIAALGEVNLRADIDAGQQREALQHLLSEREDITAAIADLRQAIAALNEQGRARLQQSFTRMSTLFSENFSALFSGGDAYLEWLESDDPIAPGIDIVARPPGKVRQSVHLLSGGEKSMTALALIGAVLKLTPTPICMLDEVDAALDDANVDRFCRLLQQLTQQSMDTRFVVVSHHRLSMAKADHLMGVGMPERGVSRLYAVDLLQSEHLLNS